MCRDDEDPFTARKSPEAESLIITVNAGELSQLKKQKSHPSQLVDKSERMASGKSASDAGCVRYHAQKVSSQGSDGALARDYESIPMVDASEFDETVVLADGQL